MWWKYAIGLIAAVFVVWLLRAGWRIWQVIRLSAGDNDDDFKAM